MCSPPTPYSWFPPNKPSGPSRKLNICCHVLENRLSAQHQLCIPQLQESNMFGLPLVSLFFRANGRASHRNRPDFSRAYICLYSELIWGFCELTMTKVLSLWIPQCSFWNFNHVLQIHAKHHKFLQNVPYDWQKLECLELEPKWGVAPSGPDRPCLLVSGAHVAARL